MYGSLSILLATIVAIPQAARSNPLQVACHTISMVTLEFLPRSHQPIRFVVTSSHANLIGSCDLGSTFLVTSDVPSTCNQRYPI